MVSLLLPATLVLLALHLVHLRGPEPWPLVDLNAERNLPTAFSALLLLTCGYLLWGISRQEPFFEPGHRAAHWRGLAVTFWFLSVDELFQIHERLTLPLHHALGTGGIFLFAWVIPYGVLTLILGGIYARFLWRLPSPICGLFLLSAEIYLGGALVMEMIGGAYAARYGRESWSYLACVTIEELMEMLGLVLFIHVLDRYRRRGPAWSGSRERVIDVAELRGA